MSGSYGSDDYRGGGGYGGRGRVWIPWRVSASVSLDLLPSDWFVHVQVAAAVEATVAVEADVTEAAVEEGMMAAAGELEAVGEVEVAAEVAAAGVDAMATGFALMRGSFAIACSSISARLD
jgi:hypothetical protein